MGRPRMIPVRHRETGQETQVGESAYPYFAGAYERLDQPAPAEQTQTVTPDKSATKRPASKDKEDNDGR
ncbi:hypothetical protein ACWEJ6_20980 [Nonomuraea sp. NPDC004702]